MIGGLTDYAAQHSLNTMLAGQASGTVPTWYLAGFPVAPTNVGGGTETTQVARIAVTASLAAWTAPAGSGTVNTKNANALVFGAAPSGANEVWTGLGLFDAATGGNMWLYIQIPTAQQPSITQGVVYQIGINELIVQTVCGANGGLTDYGATKLLNAIMRHQAMAPPGTWYLGGFTANPTSAGGGTESTRANYARVAIPGSPAGFGSATGSGTVSQSNQQPATFPQLGGTGTELWTAWELFDASAGGNGWIWGNLSPSNEITVGNGSVVQFPGGNVGLQLAYNPS